MRYKLEDDYDMVFDKLFHTGYSNYSLFKNEIIRVLFRYLSYNDLLIMLKDFQDEIATCQQYNEITSQNANKDK